SGKLRAQQRHRGISRAESCGLRRTIHEQEFDPIKIHPCISRIPAVLLTIELEGLQRSQSNVGDMLQLVADEIVADRTRILLLMLECHDAATVLTGSARKPDGRGTASALDDQCWPAFDDQPQQICQGCWLE